MSKATELRRITDLVKEVMTDSVDARNSDDKLYYLVCTRINPKPLNMPFKEVILNRKVHGYPSFTYVARAGRKIRERYPEFAGNDNVERERAENEMIFEKYAKERIWEKQTMKNS